MTTKERIIDFIKKNKKTTPKDISDNFDISTQMIHRHLKELIKKWQILKEGSSPRVFYYIQTKKASLFSIKKIS